MIVGTVNRLLSAAARVTTITSTSAETNKTYIELDQLYLPLTNHTLSENMLGDFFSIYTASLLQAKLCDKVLYASSNKEG